VPSQPDQTTVQDPSRILDEAAIIVLDRLAVEGGRATREVLFSRCEISLWGRMVNAAARRGGYHGHDDAEIEQRGKQHLFDETIARLLGLGVIVDWNGDGQTLAIDPTNLVPRRAGETNYVPGTMYWHGQRENALTELRTQLIQLRDQSFGASLRKTTQLYVEQMRRGQLKGDARDEALARLLELANVLFDPLQLANLLGISESDVASARQRSRQPGGEPKSATRRRDARRKEAAVTLETLPTKSETPSDTPDVSTDTPVATPDTPVNTPHTPLRVSQATLRQEREARGLSQRQLATLVRMSNGTVSKLELGHSISSSSWFLDRISEVLSQYPIVNGSGQS
jgi:ribosome-binding protein aMBF1 (putative translation factor)